MDFFKALQFLQRSWSDVKQETLANCFRKAGFVKNVDAAEPTLEDRIDGEVQPIGEEQIMGEEKIGGPINELNSLWAELEAMKLVEGGLNDYLAVDDQLATGGTRTLAKIVADVSKADAEESEASSDTEVMEVEEEPVPPVTTGEATIALKILQRYVDENTRNPAVLHLTDELNDFLAQERLKKMKQQNLLDYFTVNH